MNNSLSMSNTDKVLYEYYLNNGEIKKTKCTIISEKENRREKTIYEYEKENMYGSRFVSELDLGKVRSNHIYALDDDIEKYQAVFVDYVEANIKKIQQQLSRNKKVLKKIKSKK